MIQEAPLYRQPVHNKEDSSSLFTRRFIKHF